MTTKKQDGDDYIPNAKYPIRRDLFCPSCGNQGMRPRNDKDKAVSGRRRYRCIKCNARTTTPLYSAPQILPKTKITELRRHKFFVITSAVNDTPLVTAAHETFRQVAESNGGCYLVIPTVYKNPDLMKGVVLESLSWPEEILPYVCNANVDLNKSIRIKGETRIQHTVINPLSGKNHAGDSVSEIYAHPQVAMEMVATAKSEEPKMLHTTGTISQPNYSGAERAQKAKFHHSISAVIIELEGDRYYCRQIHFDGTGCYDLDRYYTPEGFTEGHSVDGLMYGDTHLKFMTRRTETLLETMAGILKPRVEMFNDLLDNYVGSHHHKGDVLLGLKKARDGDVLVKDELDQVVKFLSKHPNAYLIDSNHHRHLDQWFNRFDPKKDVINAPLYFHLADLASRDLEAGGEGDDLLKLYLQKHADVPLNFVDPDRPFYVGGVDCSQHGDRGPNGARGSARGFARTGSRTMIGHSHTPRIEKGCYQVGTSAMDLEYATGFSSWCNTHGAIYPNGKRALISIINNKLPPSLRRKP